MRALRRTVLALLLVVALAPAASATETTRPSAPPTTPPTGSAAVLDAQVERLTTDLQAQADGLSRAQAAASTALEARQQAERAAEQAARVARAEQGALAAARTRRARARAQLDSMAGALYRGGPQRQGMSYLAAALVTRDPGALLHDVEVAAQVGDDQGRAYDAFRAAEADQQAAYVRADTSRRQALALRSRATAAEQGARTAVAAQDALLAARRAQLAVVVDAAAVARRREALLVRAERVALQRSRAGIPADALAGAAVPRPTGTCRGGSLAGHPNGTLPESALCPLWGTAGQVLRADAAAAFNALSRRYAEEHGEPLCVTDSYRSLAEQVAVRAAKPTLAAVPGTSNHGWGVAVDLCGGVQTFSSPAHQWLLEHAPAYGWFLPAWASPGGSKPEPWHWEFAGREESGA